MYIMICIHCKNKHQADLLLKQTEKYKHRYCETCCNEYKNALQIIRELEDDKYERDVTLNLSVLEEYRRMYMLQDEIKSDVDRYLLSLPNPWIHASVNPEYENQVDMYHYELRDFVTLALQGNQFILMNGEGTDELLDELRIVYIKDKRNKIPNEYELTAWLQKHFDNWDEGNDKWYKISHCKIFDLKTKKKDKEAGYKYKVIVHFSTPKGYWIDVNV